MNAKVTIYITNYNYAKYIKKSLESCLNQSFKDLEIIVIDDGSTDKSKSIINKYSELLISNGNISKKFRINKVM